MKKLFVYYSFIVVNLMLVMGFASATTIPQLASAVLFFPLAAYFWVSVIPHKKKALIIPQSIQAKKKIEKNIVGTEGEILEAEVTKIEEADGEKKFDMDRRAFLKLIGSAGVTVFLFSIFTKRAQGAFFGSVPGPGIVGIKDTAGDLIDPAEAQPTDGYRLSDLDDYDSIPAYYGFTKSDGAWFIIQENSSGEFRYVSGTSDYTNATTGWPNRAALSYDYYDNVF